MSIIRINETYLDPNYVASDGDLLQSADGLCFDIYDDGLVIETDCTRIIMTPEQTCKLLEVIQMARSHHNDAELTKTEKRKLSNWRRDEH